MKIVATQQLGPQARVESAPLWFNWRWYYHVPGLVLWLPIVALLLGPTRNRTGQAWLILVPVALVAVAWRMTSRLFGLPGDFEAGMGFVVNSLAVGWAAVWLLRPWPAERAGFARFLLALAVMAAAGVLGYWGHFGTSYVGDMTPMVIFYGISAVTLLAGGILYLVNLPFMILAFKSPLYRERFRTAYGLDRTSAVGEESDEDSPFGPPVSAESSTNSPDPD